MTVEVIIGLLSNIVLLMSLAVVYSFFANDTKLSNLSKNLLIGVSVSLVGFIIMTNAVSVESGVIFDGRTILMLLTSVFFGVIPSVIGGISLSLYRIYVGGSGTLPGVLWVILPIVIGLTYNVIRQKRNKLDLTEISPMEQYLLILTTQILMVGLLFLFPSKVSLDAINAVAFPLILVYPFGGLVVSMFMIMLKRNQNNVIALNQREKEYNELFNGGSTYSFIVDIENYKIINVNEVAIKRYGYSFKEFTEMSIFDLSTYPKEKLKDMLSNFTNSDGFYLSIQHKLKNGEVIDVEVRSTPIEIDGVTYSFSTVTDVTAKIAEQRRFKNVNEKLKATLHGVTEGIIVTDVYGNIELVNKVGTEHLAEYNTKLIGEKVSDILNLYTEETPVDINEIYYQVISSNKTYNSFNSFVLKKKSGDTIRINLSISPITYENRNNGCILIFRDVTKEYIESNKIEYVSQHDFLTGLYNRYFLETELKRLDTKRQLPISLVLGDVNGLKLINDAFGHIEGDNLLIEVANIIKKSTRSEDIISRWGGDEFMILLPQTSKKNAQNVIKRINDLCSKSMFDPITPSISIGIATKIVETTDINKILIEAEIEMYSNKQNDGKVMRAELLSKLEHKINNVHPELSQHSKNVIQLSKEFGEFLNLNEDELETIQKFARYHDIGWIGIDKEILVSQTQISEQEFEKIKLHPEIGFRIMKSIPELSSIAEYISSHHEHWDGTGYPSGLSKESIPYLSRILSITDAIDMMINNEMYSSKKTIDEAIVELKRCSGTQFDPDLVNKYIEMQNKKE